MRQDLLNSIYYKLSGTEESADLQGIVNNYVKKIFVLYLDLLNDAGVDNLTEKVKVKSEFGDGKVMETIVEAGEHLIEILLFSDHFKTEIQELDDTLVESCQCQNREGVLHKIKAIIADVGSESIELKDWIKAVNGLDGCEDFDAEEDFFDLDDF
jgi:hypothetical protein